jgi:hypothetical protein
MSKLAATVLATVTFLAGVGVGVTGANENREPERFRTAEVRNAQAYADWCGGYVQVIGSRVSVEGCDR